MKESVPVSDGFSRAAAASEKSRQGSAAFPAPSLQAASGPVIQRSKITLGQYELDGSEKEDDETFWPSLKKEFGNTPWLYATSLVRIIEELNKLEKPSKWDKEVYDKAHELLGELADFQLPEKISEEQGKDIRKILLGNEKEDVPIQEKEVKVEGLNLLGETLKLYAEKNSKNLEKTDDPDVDIQSDNSPYELILQRAINNILNEYGVKMMHSVVLNDDKTSVDNLVGAKLQHSSQRANKPSQNELEEATGNAVVWVMSNDGATKEAVTKIQSSYHQKSSEAAVIEAYSSAVIKFSEKMGLAETMKTLARINLYWGPITFGRNIFIQATEKKLKLDNQWWLYPTLIHEALHSAQHPLFTNFLAEHIPEGLHSNIREGITEYLTIQIWKKVVSNISEIANKDQIPASTSSLLSASKKNLTEAKKLLNVSEEGYGPQVSSIMKIIKTFGDDGDRRLELAYFYGQLGAFLPKMN